MADMTLGELLGALICLGSLVPIAYAVDRVKKRRRRDGRQ